jgi:hypothetical protein
VVAKSKSFGFKESIMSQLKVYNFMGIRRYAVVFSALMLIVSSLSLYTQVEPLLIQCLRVLMIVTWLSQI